MTLQDGSDGLEQLTELMRDERVPESRRGRERPPADPQTQRKRRRRALLIGGIVTAVVLALTGAYAGYALTAPLGAAVAASRAPEPATPEAATIEMSPEGASAISISGGEDYLGPDASGIWMTSGGNGARPMASISKLITALVILDKRPLKNANDAGPTITFGKADHALYDKYYVLGATIAAMPTGSSMSERDALETMLVPSASNYAEAIAGWAFGSQSAFVTAAKKWLAANGLTHTTIVEPTGIDPRNTSTPSDLIALARLAAADPTVSAIVAMPYLTVPGMDQMPNTNNLLGEYGITGLKTGTLKDSGSNLLFTGTMPVGSDLTLNFVGVVLGGYSRQSVDADVRVMLESITAGFHDVPLAESGQEVGTYTTAWGESARMVLGADASIFTWSDTSIQATMQTTTLTTGADGEEAGTVTWTAGPETVTVPVVLRGSIEPPDAWWRLTHPFELGG